MSVSVGGLSSSVRDVSSGVGISGFSFRPSPLSGVCKLSDR